MTPPVSDAGPIISFARIGQLGLLRSVVSHLVIPQAVYDEIVIQGGRQAGADDVRVGA